MGKGLVFANLQLKLIANAVAIANLADNAAASPLTNLYWALHTSDPTSGDQTTGEIAYTGYVRASIARTAAALLVTGSNLSPAFDVTFPTPSGAAGPTATYGSLGTASAGAGMVLWCGLLTPAIVIVTGTPPIIGPASILDN